MAGRGASFAPEAGVSNFWLRAQVAGRSALELPAQDRLICRQRSCWSAGGNVRGAIRGGIGRRSFGLQVARANAEHGGGAKKTLAGAVQMFRELSHSTVALIAGKSEDADEDPEYLKVHVGD